MSQIRILLAEDNDDHQFLLLSALAGGRPHVNVTVVDTGAEFLRAVRSRQYDCAVLDFNLPDYKAPDLLAASSDHLRDCPALVVSSSSDQDVVISSVRNGGVDFVPKKVAVQGDELWSRVEKAVAKCRHARKERRQNERRKRSLVKAAETDALTGLSNRQFLERAFAEERWKKDRRQLMGCAMIDLDHFKSINDSFGHAAGDAVLKAVSAAIREEMTDSDMAIRLGGEEFLVTKWSANLLDTWLWADALRIKIESLTIDTGDVRLHVTASVGITQCTSDVFDHSVIRQADEALYFAKEKGRNTVGTADMVTIARELNAVAAREDLDVDARRRDLLRRLAPRMGPTQWEHVTEHCEQVSDMAVKIATLMNQTPRVIENIRIGALFHDIGKAVVPEELLAKPRTLSSQEWRLMAHHDRFSEWIASALKVDPEAIDFCRHHHTRYDSGDGGDTSDDRKAAPLGARVLCVGDALVTMLTRRSYQNAMTIHRALGELGRERGRQFDPDVVDAANFVDSLTRLMAA